MSTTHITPTPGRIVWYRGADGEIRPAIVTKGNGPYNADLFVFGRNSTDPENYHKEGVTHADPEQEPGCLQSWHRMPYQKQQAEKHADKLTSADESKTGNANNASLRAHALDMALRTPGIQHHTEILAAAKAYQAYIDGTAT